MIPNLPEFGIYLEVLFRNETRTTYDDMFKRELDGGLTSDPRRSRSP